MPMSNKDKSKRSAARPTVQYISLLILSMLLSAGTGMLFILIAGSKVAAVISVLCAAVLCLLPAVAVKAYTVFRRLSKKRTLLILCFAGAVLSLIFSLSYYVSHDYELSVYRYMRKTQADDYYFAGYESYLEDYSGAEDFMRQMKAAPASIVLEDMSEEKLERLSADDLKTINNESLWDYCGFDDILGENAQDVEKSMKAASEMSTYDFTFEYRGLHAKSFGYILTHPKLFFSELGAMITEPSLHSVKFITLVIFYLGQIFSLWMIMIRFEVTEDKRIIYITELSKKR